LAVVNRPCVGSGLLQSQVH